ncbi:MAG TPA: LacI family DNA-binding transcriptional regulator [Fimbriimonas sp.]|nr:LacI family DNA-binding transcriptional regulator [Fimbriimonas sp.]
MREQRPRSTLSDVASLAGVSESTVSLVLAGKGETRRISTDTHRRVREAARSLNYTPSLLHRSMQRGRTHVISLYNAFRNRERGDLYMDRISAAVEHAGGDLGYDILVHSNFRRSTKETYEFLNGGLADGLVLFGPVADDPLLELLQRGALPTVLISPRLEESRLSTVQDDETQGMRFIADALLAHGHRRIVAVTQPDGAVIDPTGRCAKLQKELTTRGIPFDEESIVQHTGSALETLHRALSRPERPTALFVWHDRTAYRIIEACEASGIRIPQDLSIIGYDGIVWPSTSPHVVTTVHVPLDEMAEAAVNLLHRVIEGERGPLTVNMPVRFVQGTTLGPAAPLQLFQ